MEKVIPAKFTEYELSHSLSCEKFVEIFIRKFYFPNNGIDNIDVRIFNVDFYKRLFEDILKRWPAKVRYKVSGKKNFERYLINTKKYVPQNDYIVIEESIERFLKDEQKMSHIVRGIEKILFGEQFYFCDCCGSYKGNYYYCIMQFIFRYYFNKR